MPEININLGNIPPIFAHDVALSTVTKSKKTKKGNAKKEIHTELVFIDAVRKAAIARIMLPMSTLEELPNMIEENLKKIRKELKDKSMPKEKEKTEIKASGSYLG